MNLKFSYLYRDAANYKQHNEIFFSNPTNLNLKEVEKEILKNLIDMQWFVAKDWGVADIHFLEQKWDLEIDHGWHEFTSIEETFAVKEEMKSIDDFLSVINGNAIKMSDV